MGIKVALQVHHKYDADEQEKASALSTMIYLNFLGCCYLESV